uniref:Uncharacterized protein n=1 Tax=viral metagenome TaxID=1070528 RepID=A0A6C0H377_9ZZZZ
MPSLVYGKIAIHLLTNIPGKKEIVFSRRLFYNPEFKEEDGQLSQYPFLVLNRKYNVDTIRKMTLFDKISFFFNENVLLSREDAYTGEILDANNDDKDSIRNNVLVMLETLFPTNYPVANDINNSFDILNGELMTGLLGASNYGRYSYLQDDGIYTFRKLTWLNDIINHSEYRELVNKYVDLYKFVSGNKKYEDTFSTPMKKNLNKSNQFNAFYTVLRNLQKTSKSSTNNELQKLIDFDETNEAPQIYDFLKKVALKYNINNINNMITDDKSNNYGNNSLLDTGISILQNQKNNETMYEIYVLAELFGGELNDDIMSKIGCKLEGEILGNKSNELYQKKNTIRNWDLKRFSSYIDINKMETINHDTASNNPVQDETRYDTLDYTRNRFQQQGVSINDVKAWFYKEINQNEEFLNKMNNVLQQTVDFQIKQLLSIDNIVEYIQKNNSSLYNYMAKMTVNQNKVANSDFKYKLYESYLGYDSKNKSLTTKINDMNRNADNSIPINSTDLQKLNEELYYNNIYLLVSRFLYELEDNKPMGNSGGRKKKSFTKKRSSKKRLANKWRKRVSRRCR